MVGLLMLKQLENLSDENVVLQFKRNPYYQYFCGYPTYTPNVPCNATELVHFRNRIGVAGFELVFKMSVMLHGKKANENTVLIDTPVKEVKNCRLCILHFRHVKKRTSAKKALKRLRTIAHIGTVG